MRDDQAPSDPVGATPSPHSLSCPWKNTRSAGQLRPHAPQRATRTRRSLLRLLRRIRTGVAVYAYVVEAIFGSVRAKYCMPVQQIFALLFLGTPPEEMLSLNACRRQVDDSRMLGSAAIAMTVPEARQSSAYPCRRSSAHRVLQQALVIFGVWRAGSGDNRCRAPSLLQCG